MNFDDRTLIALADPTTRAAVFDQPGLESILEAGYEAQTMAIEGPYQAVFDELRLGTAVPPVGTIDGQWRAVGKSDGTDAQFQVSGLGSDPTIRVDATWIGSILARFAKVGEPITQVSVEWSAAGRIDAEIIAADGSLPSNATALEQARRARLLEHIRAGLDQPTAFGEQDLDRFLTSVRASSVSDLLEHRLGTADGAALKVTFAAPASVGESPAELPIAAPILIRDNTEFSLTQLLSDSKSIRERILATGLARPEPVGTRQRQTVVVVWVLPVSVFDDEGWPGATAGQTSEQARAARRAAASKWLAEEGIGLVVTSES